MIAVVGLFSVVVGGGVACASERFPAHVAALETGAGILLIWGFALTSLALPAVL